MSALGKQNYQHRTYRNALRQTRTGPSPRFRSPADVTPSCTSTSDKATATTWSDTVSLGEEDSMDGLIIIPVNEELLLSRQSCRRIPFLCDCIFWFEGRTSRTRRGGGPVLLTGILDGCHGQLQPRGRTSRTRRGGGPVLLMGILDGYRGPLQPRAVICDDEGCGRRCGIPALGIRSVVFEMRESGLDSISATGG